MWLAKPLMQKQLEGMDISNVEVLSLDESPQEVKQRFNAMAEKMNDNRYEVLLKTNDKAEKTRIFARVENDIIRELIIISMGEEPALVRLKGKIQPQEIQKLTKSKQNE